MWSLLNRNDCTFLDWNNFSDAAPGNYSQWKMIFWETFKNEPFDCMFFNLGCFFFST